MDEVVSLEEKLSVIEKAKGFDPKWLLTDDGDVIRPDLMVWTYDWAWGKVNAADYLHTITRAYNSVTRYAQDPSFVQLWPDDFWFEVSYPNRRVHIYNHCRMTTMCPNCHGLWEGCNLSGCGGRKFEVNWTGWKLDRDGHTVVVAF